MTASPVQRHAHRHPCAVAYTDEGRARIVAEWVREGLGLGERVVWIEPPGGDFLTWLDAHDVAWREPYEAGALQIAHPEDVVQLASAADVPVRIAGAAELARQAVEDGHPGLRVGVETAVALTVMPDMATQFTFEAAWEALTLVEPLSLLCLYDPAVYGAGIAEGIRLHPREFVDELAQAVAGDSSVAVRGEIDLSNAAMVHRFLDAANMDEATLDLGGCGFVDLAGADELLAYARSRAPGRVRVLRPPHTLRRILELTGATHELDLEPAS